MKHVRRIGGAHVLIVTVTCLMSLLAPRDAGAQGAFYVEVPKDGRIYVFNVMKTYDEWQKTGEMGKSITRPGAGPNGETLVFDSEEAIHLYNFNHNLPGEVITKPEEKKPTTNVSWKDGKTSFEWDNAGLNLSTTTQIRFTDDMPGDPNATSIGSFRIRRVKTKFDGWIYRRYLTYDLQINFADPNNSILDDADINYDVTRGRKEFQIKGGQFKVPFGRQELTTDGYLQFVDRSIVSDEFEKSRDIGFQLWGQTPKGTIEWRGGAFNGAGRNKTVNDNGKYQYDARVTWQPLGDVRYSESDFESTTRPLIALAAQFEKNDLHGTTAGDDIDREVYSGDIVFKFKGVSIFAEYFHRVSEPEIAALFHTDAYSGQLGYFVYKRFVEVALRYATIDPSDLTIIPGVPVSDDQKHERGVALNWYMKKHFLKLQADYRQIENDLTDITDDQTRLQMQFIF